MMSSMLSSITLFSLAEFPRLHPLSLACKELRVFCKNKKPIQDDVAHDQGKSDELVDS